MKPAEHAHEAVNTICARFPMLPMFVGRTDLAFVEFVIQNAIEAGIREDRAEQLKPQQPKTKRKG